MKKQIALTALTLAFGIGTCAGCGSASTADTAVTEQAALTEQALEQAKETEENVSGISSEEAREFADKILQAIADGDVETLSDMAIYPFRAYGADQKMFKVENAAEFQEHYEEMFTKEFQEVILQEEDYLQEVGWQGWLLGESEYSLWITSVVEDGKPRIVMESLNNNSIYTDEPDATGIEKG